MIGIVETRVFQLGRYTVRQQPQFHNPSWPEFLVFLGETLIGKCVSYPDVSACDWLECQQKEQARYAIAEEASIPFSLSRGALASVGGVSSGKRTRHGRRGIVERDRRASLPAHRQGVEEVV